MGRLTKEEIARAKGKGFLLNRGTQKFNGRIVPAGCVFTAKQLAVVAEIAERFGDGKVAMTSRLAAEVSGIPFEKIEEARAYLLSEAGLYFGGTGAKIRPIAACKGTTCVFGNFDTQGLAKVIYDRYYMGWSDVVLPHKFKIALGGCPNSCMKPSLNDFGVEGHRIPDYEQERCKGCKTCQVVDTCPMGAASLKEGKLVLNTEICSECGVCIGKCPFQAIPHEGKTAYRIFIGGTWGKHPRMGTPLPRMVEEAEILPIMEKTILWFKENAYQRERLGAALDRVGIETAFSQILDSDSLLERKEGILESPLKTR